MTVENSRAWWILGLVLLAALQAWKSVEILYDIVWTAKNGLRYRDAAFRALHDSESVSLDVLDNAFGRWQPLWQLASGWPTALRALVGIVFRVPTLITLQAVLVFLIPPPATSFERAALVTTVVVLWLGIAITIAKEFVHRIHFGWFYPYRRDTTFQPTGDRVLRRAEISDEATLTRLLRLLTLVIVVLIIGFGTMYYALEIALPGSFDTGVTNSRWLACVYFSAVTMATVGFGDVRPMRDVGRALVISQIVLGPFVLTLLILALSSGLAAPRFDGGSGHGKS